MYNENGEDETFSHLFRLLYTTVIKICTQLKVKTVKKWLQKSLIIMVALLTFGVITPGHELWNALQDKGDSKLEEGPTKDASYHIGLAEPEVDQPSLEEAFVQSAKQLSYEKFGTKIGPIIEDEFDEVIFPKIEEAIHVTLRDSEDLHKRRLAISEKPAGDYGEKIFHVYDKDLRKDLIRFHVRTDKRPQEGYYFNFHYHVAEDEFTSHRTIGDIYWSKNTPPKWLS